MCYVVLWLYLCVCLVPPEMFVVRGDSPPYATCAKSPSHRVDYIDERALHYICCVIIIERVVVEIRAVCFVNKMRVALRCVRMRSSGCAAANGADALMMCVIV